MAKGFQAGAIGLKQGIVLAFKNCHEISLPTTLPALMIYEKNVDGIVEKVFVVALGIAPLGRKHKRGLNEE